MTDTVIAYTFRSLCAYCAHFDRGDLAYNGPCDAEGHATFTGGVDCLPQSDPRRLSHPATDT